MIYTVERQEGYDLNKALSYIKAKIDEVQMDIYYYADAHVDGHKEMTIKCENDLANLWNVLNYLENPNS